MKKSQLQAQVWHSLRLSGVPLGTNGANEVVRALTWIIAEQQMILNRFPIYQNDQHTLEGVNDGTYWSEKLGKFLFRANLLGLESPEGRQAIAEFSATSVGLFASVWRVYGPPPCNPKPANTQYTVKAE